MDVTDAYMGEERRDDGRRYGQGDACRVHRAAGLGTRALTRRRNLSEGKDRNGGYMI